jgi:hypothetical protein
MATAVRSKSRKNRTAERYVACGTRAEAMREQIVTRRSLVLDAGLDKLQELLLAMVPGDEVSIGRAMAVSGLERSQCDAVLDALMRAGLMIRLQHDAYVRVGLDDSRM